MTETQKDSKFDDQDDASTSSADLSCHDDASTSSTDLSYDNEFPYVRIDSKISKNIRKSSKIEYDIGTHIFLLGIAICVTAIFLR